MPDVGGEGSMADDGGDGGGDGIGMVRDNQAHTSARKRQAHMSSLHRQAHMSDIAAPRFHRHTCLTHMSDIAAPRLAGARLLRVRGAA